LTTRRSAEGCPSARLSARALTREFSAGLSDVDPRRASEVVDGRSGDGSDPPTEARRAGPISMLALRAAAYAAEALHAACSCSSTSIWGAGRPTAAMCSAGLSARLALVLTRVRAVTRLLHGSRADWPPEIGSRTLSVGPSAALLLGGCGA
jgi:hypothetical protein